MGKIADYLQAGGEGQHWRYDFRKGNHWARCKSLQVWTDNNANIVTVHVVSISASTIFSYALILPLLLWLLLWWRKGSEEVSLTFVEIICLYGYSLAIYIPILILWTTPLPLLQWLLVLLGAGAVATASDLQQPQEDGLRCCSFGPGVSLAAGCWTAAVFLPLFWRPSCGWGSEHDGPQVGRRQSGRAQPSCIDEPSSGDRKCSTKFRSCKNACSVAERDTALCKRIGVHVVAENQTLKVTVSLPSATSTDKVGGGILVRTVQNNTNLVLLKEWIL